MIQFGQAFLKFSLILAVMLMGALAFIIEISHKGHASAPPSPLPAASSPPAQQGTTNQQNVDDEKNIQVAPGEIPSNYLED